MNTNDVSKGAAKQAYRLHGNICSLREKSCTFVARKDSGNPLVIVYRPPETPLEFSNRTRKYIDQHVNLSRQFFRPELHQVTLFDLKYDDKTCLNNFDFLNFKDYFA